MFSFLVELQAPAFRDSAKEAASKTIYVKVGEKFRLNCGVRGNPKPVVRFYKDSKLLTRNDATEIEITMTTLRVNNAKLNDSGKYKCQASNSIGKKSLIFMVVVDKGTAGT